MHTELDPATYGLTIWDLDREFLTDGLGGQRRACRSATSSTSCATPTAAPSASSTCTSRSPSEKRWIQEQVEGVDATVEPEEQRHILDRLNAAEAFEKFLGTKYLGQKRFGIEGAESRHPDPRRHPRARRPTTASTARCMGMAHRGRLNVLANIVGKSYDQLFKEFEGYVDPDSTQGSGDVKYHLGQTGKFVSRLGNDDHRRAGRQPVAPRGRRPGRRGHGPGQAGPASTTPRRFSVLPLLLHGDAAFAGQGVVAETLNLSSIKGYRVGGTIHLDHQQPARLHDPARRRPARRSTAPTSPRWSGADLPRERRRPRGLRAGGPAGLRLPPAVPQGRRDRHGLLPAPRPQRGRRPELHPAADVQADRRPALGAQALHRGARQAGRHLASRRPRRPSTTSRPGCRPRSTRPGRTRRPRTIVAPPPAAGRSACCPTSRPASTAATLDAHLRARSTPRPRASPSTRSWPSSSRPATKMFAERRGRLGAGRGARLRLAAARGHRHPPRRPGHRGGARSPSATPCWSTTRPAPSTRRWPTSTPTRRKFWIYDSLLSEYAALGFEYGYSVVAQGRAGRLGGAVRRLRQRRPDHHRPVPRGRRGQVGPDLGPRAAAARTATRARAPSTPRPASSGSSRSCAEDNIQVCQRHRPSAQYFHLLRRQMTREVRKPLIVFTPKSLLRAKSARSPIDELASGSFQEVLDDPAVTRPERRSQRIVFCSGKVGHDAIARRDADEPARSRCCGSSSCTRSRTKQFAELLAQYPNATEVVWLQEEPENMGPRSFVSERLWPLVPSKDRLPRGVPGRLRQPGDRQPHHPRPGAGRHPEPDLRGPRLTRPASDESSGGSGRL